MSEMDGSKTESIHSPDHCRFPLHKGVQFCSSLSPLPQIFRGLHTAPLSISMATTTATAAAAAVTAASEDAQRALHAATDARAKLLMELVRGRDRDSERYAATDTHTQQIPPSTSSSSYSSVSCDDQFWHAATSLLFIDCASGNATCARDDMLFFVPLEGTQDDDGVLVERQSQSGRESTHTAEEQTIEVFVRRRNQPLPSSLLQRGAGATVDWRRSLYLNVICHAEYRCTATVRVSAPTKIPTPATRGVNSRRGEWSGRSGRAPAHASPSYVAAGATPRAVYPHVCYSVGGGQDSYTRVVIEKENEALEVDVGATDGAFLPGRHHRERDQDAERDTGEDSVARVLTLTVPYSSIVLELRGERSGRIRLAAAATDGRDADGFFAKVDVDVVTVAKGSPNRLASLQCTPVAVLLPWQHALSGLIKR